MARRAPATPRPWRDDPAGVKPMLAESAPASTHDRLLGRDDLVFEPKYDGIRALVVLEPEPAGDGPVRIISRLGNDKTDQFPDLVAPLAMLAERTGRALLLDGEIVAVDPDGQELGFQHLQGRLNVRGLRPHRASRATAVVFVAFDLLRDGGDDLRPLPGRERRRRLEQALVATTDPALRLIDRHEGPGWTLRDRARAEDWEGLVAKDPAAAYHSGRRHASWKKLKFVQTEEFVVGGWTTPRSTRTQFGALLLGYYPEDDPEGDTLVFAGQVGSGFTRPSSTGWPASWRPALPPTARSATFPATGPTITGWSRRSWSRRSSPSGRSTVSCATRSTSESAPTATRGRCDARARGRRGRPPPAPHRRARRRRRPDRR